MSPSCVEGDVTALATRTVGTTGVAVSVLGFGGAAIGNLYAPVDDAEARGAVAAARAAGIRYFDTAPYYGFGLSERRLGDGLRDDPDAIVSSKVGCLLEPDAAVRDDREREGFRSPMPFRPTFDHGYDAVMRSWEASLQRIGRARIDILYLHDFGPDCRDMAAMREGLRALRSLRDQGTVRAIGIGVNDIPICHALMAEAQLDVILLAGRYTLLEQGALDALMPACATAGTSLVIGGPYNSGILASGTRGGPAYYDYAPAPADIVATVARIETICDRYGLPLAAAALQFPLAHPLVASVIPGLPDAARVEQAVALATMPIPPDFWSELVAAGLIRDDAPVPAGAFRDLTTEERI